jgi:hypothetical protein
LHGCCVPRYGLGGANADVVLRGVEDLDSAQAELERLGELEDYRPGRLGDTDTGPGVGHQDFGVGGGWGGEGKEPGQPTQDAEEEAKAGSGAARSADSYGDHGARHLLRAALACDDLS